MGPFGSALDNLPRACEDIGITSKRLQADVTALKDWLRQQPHLPNVEDGLLVENMLLRNKGSVELAKQTLEFFFSSRVAYPELFSEQDPCSEEISRNYELRKMVLLKELTTDGYRVAISNLPDPDAKVGQYHIQSTLKQWIMQFDLLTDEDISCGMLYIIDASNLCLAHSTMLLKDFALFQKTLRCAFSGYKFRMKGIHFLQPPTSIDSILRMVKKVLPKKVAGRIHLHHDLASLHRHVEKEVLPSDYGGNQKPFLELAAEWRQEEIGYRQWFLDHEQMWKTDETKRPAGSVISSPSNDSFGINGSFKKLEFD